MKCPYCFKELQINENVLRNVETYNRPVKFTTHCCGHIVTVVPRVEVDVYKDISGAKEDDWGTPALKSSEPLKVDKRLETFLRRNGFWEKFQSNTYLLGSEIEIQRLTHAFKWDQTPEGHNFWAEVNNLFEKQHEKS